MPVSLQSQLNTSGAESFDHELPPAVLVDTPHAFDLMMVSLARQPIIAVDTESDSLYRYFYKVCLIQISTPAADYLVDPLRLPDVRPLGSILADPGIEKVFHAAENDILMLKRDFAFSFSSIFDTMFAARILGWSQVGLASILKLRFGVTLDKRAQLTNWGQRPLARAQLSYARLDSHYLLTLRDVLARELQQRKRWREASEAFQNLQMLAYMEKPFDPEGFWRIKGARDMRSDELAVLRELYLWRDEQARAADRPPFKILGDDVLVQFSKRQPRRLSELSLNGRQAELYGSGITAAISRGLEADPPLPPQRAHSYHGRPDPQVVARFERLRVWRAQRAQERGVDADIVMTNDALMAVARAFPSTLEALAGLGIMGAWKLEEYGSDLVRVLAAS